MPVNRWECDDLYHSDEFCQSVAVVILYGIMKKHCLWSETKVYSSINETSPKSWSFLFRIFHHTAAAAPLAATLGFPLTERDLQYSLPAWISISLSDCTQLNLFAQWQNAPPVLSSIHHCCSDYAGLNYFNIEWINRCSYVCCMLVVCYSFVCLNFICPLFTVMLEYFNHTVLSQHDQWVNL